MMKKRIPAVREVVVELVATVDDRVIVKNPRSRLGNWEPGKVTRAEVSISRDGSYWQSFDVLLDRLLPDTIGRYKQPRLTCRWIRVHVGRNDIKLDEEAVNP